jgi:hypothetical protein
MFVSLIGLQIYLIASGLVVWGIKLAPWVVSRNLYFAGGLAIFALWEYIRASDEAYRKLQLSLIFASVVWAGSIILLMNSREHVQTAAAVSMALGDFVAWQLVRSLLAAASLKRRSTTAA